jgi:hypothetical protein
MLGVAALAVGVAAFAAPSQGHAGTGCSDCYVVSYAASLENVAAGTGHDFAFQVANHDPHETLQTLTFTAPADFVITGGSGPAGTSVSNLTASSVTLDLPGNAGSTFTVDVTALAPCVSAGAGTWAVSGVDSRGETGEVGWSPAPLSTSLTGQCSLAFTGEPAQQTSVNSDILTGFNSTGSPLAVQLLDADGGPLDPAGFSASGTPVTVSIAANPGDGTLSGTTTVDSSNGVARFGDLQINQPGAGYDLAANATGFAPATSGFFAIAGQIQPCGTGSCSASQSTATTSASVTTSSQPGDFVTLGLGGVNLTCNHYQAVSDTADFGIVDSSGGSVADSSANISLTISKSAVDSARRPLFLWQVCYGAQTPFPAIPGTHGTTTIGGTTYNTGLLLPCFLFSHRHPQPCLLSRQRIQGGAIKLTFLALGDPLGKG